MFTEYEIRQLPLSVTSVRTKVELFLSQCGLRLDPVEYYAGVFAVDDDRLLAGGGLEGNLIKCIAVSDELRSTGMSNRLISHLISHAATNGHTTIRVFTKPENENLFGSQGFHTIARASLAVLMENNSNPLDSYVRYLQSIKREGRNGVIVMNANPFTLGHRYLVETAAKETDNLYVIVVKEDLSAFSYADRYAMIKAGCEGIENVTVCEGSNYAISALTFPTYFIKQLDHTTETHIQLDLDLFAKHIAPALNCTVRFVGSEPTDKLTSTYNQLMKQLLPQRGIEVREIERYRKQSVTISASTVRQCLDEHTLNEALAFTPHTTHPYLIAQLSTLSLQQELDTTPKPGLVDLHDNGAHSDMNPTLMKRSIDILHPYFVQLANISHCETLPTANDIRSIGLEAEQAMLTGTNGINTHKGALFAHGLTICAAANALYTHGRIDRHNLQSNIKQLASKIPSSTNTHGSLVVKKDKVIGALQMAQDGYTNLFNEWLPFYDEHFNQQDVNHRLLLLIMSHLDDTNVIHRSDYKTAQWLKQRSKEVFNNYSHELMHKLNDECIQLNISPGGAADMLALTIFVHSLIDKSGLHSSTNNNINEALVE